MDYVGQNWCYIVTKIINNTDNSPRAHVQVAVMQLKSSSSKRLDFFQSFIRATHWICPSKHTSFTLLQQKFAQNHTNFLRMETRTVTSIIYAQILKIEIKLEMNIEFANFLDSPCMYWFWIQTPEVYRCWLESLTGKSKKSQSVHLFLSRFSEGDASWLNLLKFNVLFVNGNKKTKMKSCLKWGFWRKVRVTSQLTTTDRLIP